jgi:hypothetical protein
MSNQNENQLHEDLKHYVWVQLTDEELSEYTIEQLREAFRDLEKTNWQISAAYGHKKHFHEQQLKVSQDLRTALAEWRYAARTLFSAAVKSTEWISAVKANLQHIEGFTHHMKSVVNQLNINELESAETELTTPIDRIRDLLKKDSGMSDIPF